MITDSNTLLCSRNIFVFCKMFNFDYINECTKEIELFDITFHRPILFLICIFAIIMSFSSIWNCVTKFIKDARGRFEYTSLFFISTLWYILLLADRCIIYYVELPGTFLIFIETLTKVLLSFSFLNCSLIDYFNHKVSLKKYITKTIIVYLISLLFVCLLITSYFISNIVFEIVYLIGVYVPLIASFVLYFISSIRAQCSRICLLILLIINFILFISGLILYLFHNQDACEFMWPFFASEEIFALSTSVSLWLFFRFSRKLKESILEGVKVGEIEYNGKKHDVEMFIV